MKWVNHEIHEAREREPFVGDALLRMHATGGRRWTHHAAVEAFVYFVYFVVKKTSSMHIRLGL
jgi:hypothetical protein